MSDPAFLWPEHESRAVTFENPTGERSAGGTAAEGRKGAPNRILQPGEAVQLARLAGPGRLTHLWMTIGDPANEVPDPAFFRSQVLEAYYGGGGEPSVSVPAPDFFGVVHGVGASYTSALTVVNGGRGWASRVPMPFERSMTLTYRNGSDRPAILYYQADFLLGPQPHDTGYLHATFRRENPTTIGRDFVIFDGLRGPGRFLGFTGGVRVLDNAWWGEGEVKVYLDGEDWPTICGTGTEDYLDAAWGLGTFSSPESGAPLVAGDPTMAPWPGHSLVSIYRWHLSDPIVFQRSARVTIQQMGSMGFRRGDEDAFARFRQTAKVAGGGWQTENLPDDLIALGLYERADDWCATAFVYCAQAQPVPAVDLAAAAADCTGVPAGHLIVRAP